MKSLTLALALAQLPLSALLAQTPTAAQPARLTVERLHDDPALNGPVTRSPKISPDGKLATWLRPNDADAQRLDLWAAPVAGGEAFMLVDSRALVPNEGVLSEEEKARRERQRLAGLTGIVAYQWDSQGKAVLVPLGGDLYVVPMVDGKAGAPQRLTETPAFETDAKISPAGGYVSFIRDGALHAVRLADRVEQRLSPEASGTVTYGMAEFIAQEEMRRTTGYWWSPGDAKVAFTRVDEVPVAIVPRVEINARSTTIVQQRYPRAGTANALVSLFIRDVATGRDVAVDLGSETDIYLARVDWSKDGRTLYVQRQNRAQTRLDLLMVDPETGASRVILTQEDPAWVNLTNDFKPLTSGDFLWTTEASGWNHIVRYSRDGTNPRPLTRGTWPVIEVSGVDEAAGRVFFTSNRDDVIERRLYSVPLTPGRRMAEPVAVTPAGGVWTITLAEAGTSFLGAYSDPDTPPRLGFFRADGSLVRWMEENRFDDTHPWAPYRETRARQRFGTLTGPSGDTLYWSMHLPPGFDPAKKWPVIVHTYGGPGSQFVTRSWGSNADQLHAANGYIVFRLDNRGTPNRGARFERAIHKQLGTPEVEDQLAGLNFLKEQPFVDAGRIGVRGWSYGGTMALRLATMAPEAFAAYAAGAPVTDWALYDTHYTERYLGTPQAGAEAYRKASVLGTLKAVKRPLLVLHGMADDNVTFDNTTAALDELQAASVPFEVMVYPGQRHGIRGKARMIHLDRLMLDFFNRHLGGGGPRD